MAILIIEDSLDIQQRYRRRIARDIEIIAAYDLGDAMQKIDQLSGLQAIVFDGSLDFTNALVTIPLVKQAQQRHTCPLIAASRDRNYRNQLVEAGCTHQASKESLPAVINRLLGDTT